jgi:DNA-directed RNA polymerase specialized sigma24 family protein
VNTIALNVYRKQIRTDPLNRPVADSDQRINGLRTSGINLAAIDVANLLTCCRPSDRSLLEQQMNGLTPAEIARKEGVTQTAIRIRLLRARRDLRSRIAS